MTRRTRRRRSRSKTSCSRTAAHPRRSCGRARSTAAATGWRASGTSSSALLDKRPYIVLTGRGASHFHTTASENIGELVRLIAQEPRTGAFNSGDPDPPTVLELARAIGEAAGHRYAEVLLPTFEGERRADTVVGAEAADRRHEQGRERARVSAGDDLGGGAAAPGRVAADGDARPRLAGGAAARRAVPAVQLRGRGRARPRPTLCADAGHREGRMRPGRAGRLRPSRDDRQARRAGGGDRRERRAARALPGDLHPGLSVEPLGAAPRGLGRRRAIGVREAGARVADHSQPRRRQARGHRAHAVALARRRRQRARARHDLQRAVDLLAGRRARPQAPEADADEPRATRVGARATGAGSRRSSPTSARSAA